MGKRLLFLSLVWVAFAPWAFAQPAEDEPGFVAPVLEPPPREESGPLAKKAPGQSVPSVPAGDTMFVGGTIVSDAEPTDETRLKGYVDGLVSGLISAGEFPGASVLVIQDGKIALKAGYGYADIRARIPVDPDRTRFRVASISKLFTATAVMQLAEQGKLNLSADVNTYLAGFKIPPTYPEPVTLANILTHTAGFDDQYVGLSAPLSTMIEPLGQYLSRTMPPRVLPPGKMFSYSNHGMALAGHIVESVSGQEFGAYVQQNIFAPLGMASSTFGVPYPLPQDIAVPYFKGGKEEGFTRAELDRVRGGPAGDLITTAGDIAKFMLVHMNNGIYGDDEHLLAEQTAEKMHARHFGEVDGLDGWAYGFMEGHRNGVRWIGHDGSWLGFCAQLVMVPELKTGFFVVYNADCHFSASASLRKSFFDLLWPPKGEIAAEVTPNSEMRARSVAGTYMAVRRARADFTVMAAAASQVSVKAPGDGELLVYLPSAKRDLRFLPRANGTWINPEYQWKAAALVDGNGQATQFVLDSFVYDRVVGASEWAIWSVALGVVVGICVMTLWGWANGFLSRQFFGEPQAIITFMPRIIAFLAAGLTIVALVGMSALLGEKVPLDIVHGPTPMLLVLLSVPVAILVLVIPMIVWSISGFGTGGRARTAQAGYAVLTIAVLVFLAFCWQWGLHPFALKY
jgi:CubicO group peptidase (beta-lactamase class C family)